MSPSKNPQTQCPRAIRECSKSVQSKSGLAALPASVLPEKTEVCRLYFYLTLPNRWCAQMRRTERRGYRTAKAVELLVKVRRRTQNPVRRRAPKRSLVQRKADEEELAAAGAGYHKSQGKVEGGKGTSWGCQGDVFRCEDRAVERLLRGVGCVWVSLLRYRYLGFVVFLKGDFECCESC